MERWLNAKGDRIHHIEPDVCIYPHQPNTARILQKFEAPSNSGDNFATRIRVRLKLNTVILLGTPQYIGMGMCRGEG